MPNQPEFGNALHLSLINKAQNGSGIAVRLQPIVCYQREPRPIRVKLICQYGRCLLSPEQRAHDNAHARHVGINAYHPCDERPRGLPPRYAPLLGRAPKARVSHRAY